ncbi:APC family permease [Amaricoccus tamworthensis]|uniref:APC family permease n=1 Tax=Amaricoccus tamworthensis TaxID=57002 RepID=UPI003C7B7987
MDSEDKFKKVIGDWDVLALAFGAMIGWGWVVLAGTWITNAGSYGALVGFAVGGVAVVLIGLTYAELASAMPKTGGEHVYSHRAMGGLGSFVCTWAIIFGYVSVVAFEAVALPTVVAELIPAYKQVYLYSFGGSEVYLTWAMLGSGAAALMTWVNIRGIQTCALVQKVVILVILLGGIAFFAGAFTNGSSANAEPLFVGGVGGIFSVLVMVPFLFVGFDVIPQAAEEINLPPKRIGSLLIVSVLLAVVFYMLVAISTGRALDAAQLDAANIAAADAATAVLGSQWGGTLVILAGIGGIITSWNAFLIGGSRAIYALAEARMLPAFLAKLHPEYRTPVNAILLIGTISVFAPLLGRGALVWFVDAGGLGIVVAYAMVAVSFILLRKNEPDMPRPYRAGKGPWVGYAALVLSVGLALLYLPWSPAALIWPVEWAIALAWTVLGAGFYIYARLVYGEEVMPAH